MPRKNILFVYGNPLLDISAEVDEGFLKKYDLEANSAILADDKHVKLYDDLCENYSVEYTPGGAAQNTARIAQWLIGIPEATTYMGCISDDKYGKILAKMCHKAGVNVSYQYNNKESTGTCAVLVSDGGKNRSLVAYLAAANTFTKSHLDEPKNKALMEEAQFYYISGYPLTVCPEAMIHIAKHATSHDKLFSLNLSAPFLCSVFKDQMLQIMPYVDLLFGNESEAAEFSKANDLGLTDVTEIAIRISRFPKENGKCGRVVIITQGDLPTIVVSEGKSTEYPVIHIKPEEIVDCNGAGDSFVGGFLAALAQGKNMEECMRCANYAANVIIQTSGCSLPDKPNFSHGPAGF